MKGRFVFRLEAALRQRLREEQTVQVALARAVAAVELARRVDELASANRTMVGLGEVFDPQYRMNALYYIERLRQAVWQQEELIARVDGEVTRIRELLLTAALQRRALEKLKERQESRFRAAVMQKNGTRHRRTDDGPVRPACDDGGNAMTRIDQNMAAATVAQAQAAPAASTGSGVLIPFNAPASTSFDQVMQSIGANSGSGSTSASTPASSLTPLTPPVSSTSTGATAGGNATMGAGSTTGALGSTSPSMTGALGSTSPSMGLGSTASSMSLGSTGLSMPTTSTSSSDLAALLAGHTGAAGCCCCCCGAQGAMSTTSAMMQPAAPSSGGAADLSAVGAAAQGLGSRIQAAALSDNALAMPFQGSAPLTQAFGPTPYLAEPAYNGYSHFHTGLDYGLPLGTPIDAAAGGTVVAAGWDTTGFGNRVIVDHDNGVRTLYGHLQKVEVQPGAVVTAGQEIGLSGSTGNSSGPHLHFGVEKDGQWVDPTPYLNHSLPTTPAGASTQPIAPQSTAASMGAMGMNPAAGATSTMGTTGATSTMGTTSATSTMGTTSATDATSMVGSPGSAGATSTAGSSQALNPAPVGGGSATGYTPDIPRLVKRVAAATGVSAGLISAVVKAESGGDPHAVSRAGAKGLMQLMDATAATYGVTNVFDPLQNLTAGATYLHTLLQRYHGDETLAIAAYNAGPAAVDRYSGIPPYPETQDYVQRVTQYQKEAGQ